MSSSSHSDLVLRHALRDFENSLTPEQRTRLSAQTQKPDASAVLVFTAQLDAEYAKKGRHCISSRICTFLDSVQQFSTVVDTFVSSNPNIAALIWGSIRFTFLVAVNVSTYFDKLSKLLMDLRNHCPRFLEYQDLFSGSKRLQEALCKYYALVVNLCQKAMDISQRPAVSYLAVTLWRPYEIEFGELRNNLEHQCKEVEAEIRLAADAAAQLERERQEKERGMMKIFRKDDSKWKLESAAVKSRAKKQRLLDALTLHSHLPAFKQARKRRLGHTCSWLVATDEFKSWNEDSRSSLFWCHGKMGCGKTVMCAYVVDTILCNPRLTTRPKAMFFCQFQSAASLTSRVILGCLTKQLVDAGSMTATLTTRLSSIVTNDEIDPEDLAGVLKELAKKDPPVIVLDGLDECDKADRLQVLRALNLILSANPNGVKIFITSRPNLRPEISFVFRHYISRAMALREVSHDIETYIDGALQEKMDSGQLKVGDARILPEIKACLLKESQGMMLWVSFQIDEISQQKSDRDIRLALKTLPKDLPEIYERALGKMLRHNSAKEIIKELQWVATAKRPLSVAELREAIAIEPHQNFRHLDEYVNDEDLLVQWCAGIVFLNEEDQTVQFVHPSVQTFFTSPPRKRELAGGHFSKADANLLVGKACTTYLNFNDFKTQMARIPKVSHLRSDDILRASVNAGLNSTIARSSMKLGKLLRRPGQSKYDIVQGLQNAVESGATDPLRRLQQDFALLAYASEYWLLHTADLTPSDERGWIQWQKLVEGDIGVAGMPWPDDLWMNGGDVVLLWIIRHDHLALLMYMMDSMERSRKPAALDFLLVQAASGGRLPIFQALIHSNKPSRSARGEALQKAAGHGHLEIVEILLVDNTDVNPRPSGGYGQTALQAAAGGGYVDVVERLLAAKAEVNAPPALWNGRIALQAAAGGGHLDVVERLLAAKAEVNAPPAGHGRTALQAAAGGGYVDVVERLLAAKAEVNAPPADNYGRTALQAAAGGGYVDVVERLLAAKAEVNAPPAKWNGRTALQAAAGGGYVDVVERLLAAKAEVNAPPADNYGRTALQAAAGGGYVDVVERLLAAKAEVNAPPALWNGRTALQAAAGGGYVDVVERLLAAKAEVNAPPAEYDGRTALQAAVEGGYVDVVERLLAAKAEVNAPPALRNGRTALQAAAGGGYVDVVERLLAAKAEVNAPPADNYGRTALQAAIDGGYLDVVRVLESASKSRR